MADPNVARAFAEGFDEGVDYAVSRHSHLAGELYDWVPMPVGHIEVDGVRLPVESWKLSENGGETTLDVILWQHGTQVLAVIAIA